MLKIEKLCKNFSSLQVLKDLDLTVDDGSIFGLVGVNGAGKSTLLRCISGVYQPEGGQVLLDGENTYQNASVRNRIAYVSDELYFPMASTIRSQKAFYKDLYDFDEVSFQNYLHLFDLEEKMSINNLSKGNRRRVALVFALSIHPKLLLLDEAYDGLEPVARLHFKKVLSQLVVEDRLSVIISSHNLKELEDICDAFGILDGGKIMDYGDLLQSRDNLNKYQVAFREPKSKEDFKDLAVLRFSQEGKVISMVIRGQKDQVCARLSAMDPLLLDVVPCSFEELFIYEVEQEEEGAVHE